MNKELFTKFAEQEVARGNGGVMYIKDNEFAYLFSYEFSNKDFASKLQDILDDNKENIYIVVEKEKQLHLFSYPKNETIAKYTSDTLISEET